MDQVTFTTEDGIRLEGELRMPDGAPRGAAVICHPHPRHGGSKDHPLLWAIRNDLAAARGLAVLGFNFRGVMGSSGTYGGGRDELRDTRAASEAARSHSGLKDPPTVVVGWSFGASVALREALDDGRVSALALVGIPLRPGDVEMPPLPTGPICGSSHARDAPRRRARPVRAAGGPPRVRRAVPAGRGRGRSRDRPLLLASREEAASVVGAFADRVLNRP
jgi:pimeloyl-ACP methyl ester carboxylesterase